MVKKIIVTGGSGFIGSYITKMLAATHPAVTVVSLSRQSVEKQIASDPYKAKFKNIQMA